MVDRDANRKPPERARGTLGKRQSHRRGMTVCVGWWPVGVVGARWQAHSPTDARRAQVVTVGPVKLAR